MAEKHVARKLKDNSPHLLWEAISDKYGVGTPDRCVLARGKGLVAWIELKYLKQAPSTKCKCGLKGVQAQWLQRWQENGGTSLLIVGVGSDKVSIFSDGFIDIYKNGIMREQFELINYEEAESKLLGLMGNGKKKTVF